MTQTPSSPEMENLMMFSASLPPVPLITVAHSSPWTPPWLDTAFQRFLEQAPASYTTDVDDPHWQGQGFSPRLFLNDDNPWPETWAQIVNSPTIQAYLQMQQLREQAEAITQQRGLTA